MLFFLMQRKANIDNPKPRVSKKSAPKTDYSMGMNEHNKMESGFEDSLGSTHPQQPKVKKPKRPKKSINDNLEPAFAAPKVVAQNVNNYPFKNDYSPDDYIAEAEAEGISPIHGSPTR